MKALTEAQPGQRPYQPHGAALTVFHCRDPEILIAGPSGTGKSRAVLEKLHLAADKYPGMRALIVRKTRKSCTESVMVTFEAKVLPEGSPLARGPDRQYRNVYRHPNGSEIVVGGLDNPDRIMSTEYDLIYVAEATECTERDWEQLSSRLRNGVMPYQQIIGDCNPSHPGHWLKRRCDVGVCTMLHSRHEDNPLLWDNECGDWTEAGSTYLARLDRLTGVRYERLRLGKWCAVEGMVYAEWDSQVHIVDRFPIPAEWRRFCSIDFGFTNPFCCLWVAIDPDGRAFIYRQLYHTQRLVEDHAGDILRLSQGETIENTVADSADAEGRATLHNRGIATISARKDIAAGLQAVSARLRKAGDGKPRLFVLRDSLVERDRELVSAKRPTCIEDEFDCYCWPQTPEGKALKEKPVDDNNHALDAVRYLAMHLDGGVSSGIAFLDEPRSAERREWKREDGGDDGGWCHPDNPAVWTEFSSLGEMLRAARGE